jgi:putative Mn2+ efflux pump MntP
MRRLLDWIQVIVGLSFAVSLCVFVVGLAMAFIGSPIAPSVILAGVAVFVAAGFGQAGWALLLSLVYPPRARFERSL